MLDIFNCPSTLPRAAEGCCGWNASVVLWPPVGFGQWETPGAAWRVGGEGVPPCRLELATWLELKATASLGCPPLRTSTCHSPHSVNCSLLLAQMRPKVVTSPCYGILGYCTVPVGVSTFKLNPCKPLLNGICYALYAFSPNP